MIAAHQLSVKRGNATLLDQVTLTVAAGELLMVLGANGAGKSTLLQALSGVIKPTQGLLKLSDKGFAHYTARERAKRMACLHQQTELTVNFSVQDVVALGRYPYANEESTEEKQAAVLRALIRTDTEYLIHRGYHTLSGGEQQRVQLARVLAQIDQETSESRFLLLDEHVAHLDIAHQHHVFQLLSSLRKEKIGVVAVVHDINLALAYADNVVLLKQGRLVIEGRAEVVLTTESIREIFNAEVAWAVDHHARSWVVPCLK